MAQIEILSESEVPGGWCFTVEVRRASGSPSRHEVNLAWVDYNHWSRSGGDEPSAVVAAVVRFLLSLTTMDEIRPRFDAAIARRLDPEADALIPPLIGVS